MMKDWKYIKKKLPPVNIVSGRNNSEYFYSRYRDMVLKEPIANNSNTRDTEIKNNISGVSKRLKSLKDNSINSFNIGSKKNKKKYNGDSAFNKKKKEKLPSPRFVTDEQLKEMGYPKTYYDPTDEEIGDDGVANYYFNINKTFEKYNLGKLAKKLPMEKLDSLTYNKPFLDKYAVKQHANVEKMNSLEPKEQYKKDIQNKNKKRYALLGSIAAVFCLVFMVIIPSIQFSSGMSAFEKKDYLSARDSFSAAGSHKNADMYAYFCSAKTDVTEKKYDEAKTKLQKLIDGKYTIEGIDLNDEVLDVDYQKALAYYTSGDYNNAKKTFYHVIDYSDAKNYYNKCGYKLGSDYYENGKIDLALKEFFYVKGYSDAEERIEEIAGKIYNTGLDFYNKNDFVNASIEFAKISKYNYKDSVAMEQQCTYKNGINAIAAESYENAISILKPLKTYKDSFALLSEAYYRLGNNLFLNAPSESINYYSLIPYYRDVEEKLLLPQLVLYGSWNITEIDNVSQSDLEFSFDSNGNLITKNNLNNIAISTEAMSHPYIWSKDSFVCEGYTIKVNVEDYNNIELICNNLGSQTIYKCSRISMLGQNNQTSPLDEFNSFEKGTLEYYLQEYVNEKTDGIIIINNKKYELDELTGKKPLTESTPSEAKK